MTQITSDWIVEWTREPTCGQMTCCPHSPKYQTKQQKEYFTPERERETHTRTNPQWWLMEQCFEAIQMKHSTHKRTQFVSISPFGGGFLSCRWQKQQANSTHDLHSSTSDVKLTALHDQTSRIALALRCLEVLRACSLVGWWCAQAAAAASADVPFYGTVVAVDYVLLSAVVAASGFVDNWQISTCSFS